MNTYSIRCFLDGNTPGPGWVAGDAASAARLCAVVGHLWMMSTKITSGGSPARTAGKFNAKDAEFYLDFQTKLRLPSALDLPPLSAGQLFNAAAQCWGSLVAEDDSYTDRVTNLGRPIVVAGALIVALTRGGVDVTDELTTQLRFPVGVDANGIQYLNIGFATSNAQDGVYQTPFSTALAYWTGGTARTNVPVLVTSTPGLNYQNARK